MYKFTNVSIPQEQRAKINQEIIEDIKKEPIFKKYNEEYVFNYYTGKGGLHGLNEKDFQNYNEYKKAKQKFEEGQFFTPPNVCKYIVELLSIENNALIGDLTCGMGNFFNYLPREENIYGCEIDYNAYLVAQYLYPNANLECNDIQHYICPKHRILWTKHVSKVSPTNN